MRMWRCGDGHVFVRTPNSGRCGQDGLYAVDFVFWCCLEQLLETICVDNRVLGSLEFYGQDLHFGLVIGIVSVSVSVRMISAFGHSLCKAAVDSKYDAHGHTPFIAFDPGCIDLEIPHAVEALVESLLITVLPSVGKRLTFHS